MHAAVQKVNEISAVSGTDAGRTIISEIRGFRSEVCCYVPLNFGAIKDRQRSAIG